MAVCVFVYIFVCFFSLRAGLPTGLASPLCQMEVRAGGVRGVRALRAACMMDCARFALRSLVDARIKDLRRSCCLVKSLVLGDAGPHAHEGAHACMHGAAVVCKCRAVFRRHRELREDVQATRAMRALDGGGCIGALVGCVGASP